MTKSLRIILQEIKECFINFIIRIIAVLSFKTKSKIGKDKPHRVFGWEDIRYHNEEVKPEVRWGQACVSIQGNILVFGGYYSTYAPQLETMYYNDLWLFNSTLLKWVKIQINSQEKPSPRSCSSMHYDSKRERIVLFGGGSLDTPKNDIYFLKWGERIEWEKFAYSEVEPRPFERTYHSSNLLQNYMVIFGGYGGYGVTDFNDLWAFDLSTERWVELKAIGSVFPETRRFHSSVVIGYKLYVISGIHSKEKLLNNIYSIDLEQFVKHSDSSNLEWILQLNGSDHLDRWGHSCIQYEGNILVLGGKIKMGSDVVSVNLKTKIINHIKVEAEQPFQFQYKKSSVIKQGRSLLLFGGFDGKSYNKSFRHLNLEFLSNRENLSTQTILHAPDIFTPRLTNDLETDYFISTLTCFIEQIYFQKKVRAGSMLCLSKQEYADYLDRIGYLRMGQTMVKAERFEAMINLKAAIRKSEFLSNMMKYHPSSAEAIINIAQTVSQEAFFAFINYLNTGCPIFPQHFSVKTLSEIHSLTCYFAMKSQSKIMQRQLMNKIDQYSCKLLLKHASTQNSSSLFHNCVSFILHLPQSKSIFESVRIPTFQLNRIKRIKENLAFDLRQQQMKAIL